MFLDSQLLLFFRFQKYRGNEKRNGELDVHEGFVIVWTVNHSDMGVNKTMAVLCTHRLLDMSKIYERKHLN